MKPFLLPALALLFSVAPLVAVQTGQEAFVAWTLGEDGLYETWGTMCSLVAALVFGALYCFPPGIDRRNHLHLLFSAGLFFLFGEEPNWGQRQLSLDWPGWVPGTSQITETALHTLHPLLSVAINLASVLLLYAYLVGLPLLRAMSTAARRWLDMKRAPLATPSMACALLMPLVALVWPHQLSGQALSEIFEAVGQTLLCLLAVRTYRQCESAAQLPWRAVQRRHRRLAVAVGSIVVPLTAVVAYHSVSTLEPVVSHELALAREHMDERRYDLAGSRIEAALRLRPNDLAVRLGYAELLHEEERFEELRDLLFEILDAHPDQFATQVALVHVLRVLDEESEARVLLETTLSERPDDVELLLAMGLELFETGQYREADEYFQRIIEIDSNHDIALKMRAAVDYYSSGATATGR